METAVYNQSGKKTETLELPESVFGLKWNADLVHQAVESERANQRKKVAHVKMRGEVSGGGKKPWRQKGTGRARHGSIRSPIWRHGGVAHGPNPETVYTRKFNKKMARKALATVLSAKLRDNEIVFVENGILKDHKTKHAVSFLKALMKEFPKLGFSGGRTLILTPHYDIQSVRAVRNIQTVDVKPALMAQVHETLSYKYIVIPKEAVDVLKKRINQNKK